MWSWMVRACVSGLLLALAAGVSVARAEGMPKDPALRGPQAVLHARSARGDFELVRPARSRNTLVVFLPRRARE
jgi:hypothetical protein